ncbi:hypothetical protein BLNAU_17132 [Blattamonas nauphoetae]|uniref:Uncharacterized protein n=1 Tax=Blattamonas nauphoetae TaxID=2049346 RepID=A0ABQ9XCH1_9EUKA|nr:hypothetical protein BLNAU_17132 [Blattamonas nauphoetae]
MRHVCEFKPSWKKYLRLACSVALHFYQTAPVLFLAKAPVTNNDVKRTDKRPNLYLKTGQIGHVLSCPVLFSDHLPHVKLSSSALFFLDISYRDLKSTIPQYLTVTCLALSLLLFRYSFFMLPFFTDMTNAFPQQCVLISHEVEMDEMGNVQYQILTLKVDDPTKSSVSLVIPTQPTPNVSFTHAMSNSLHHVPNPSIVGPSQIQTKPPTVHPASSPTPVILSVNNQKSPANSHTASPFVSPINHNTSRPPTSGPNLQSKLLSEQLSRKVPKCTSTSPVQEAIKYFSVKELRKNRECVSLPNDQADGKRGEAFLNTLFHDQGPEKDLIDQTFIDQT